MTTQSLPAPTRALGFVRSKLTWLALAAAAAAAWAYRRLAGPPAPLTRAEEKQRRKSLARAATGATRRKR